jgi:hypothetical protein
MSTSLWEGTCANKKKETAKLFYTLGLDQVVPQEHRYEEWEQYWIYAFSMKKPVNSTLLKERWQIELFFRWLKTESEDQDVLGNQ